MISERERESNEDVSNDSDKNRKKINEKISRKKVYTKALHLLSIMGRRALAMRTENVTNIATPKGKLSIVSLVKEELEQVYFKTTHRLVRFHLRRERVPNR